MYQKEITYSVMDIVKEGYIILFYDEDYEYLVTLSKDSEFMFWKKIGEMFKKNIIAYQSLNKIYPFNLIKLAKDCLEKHKNSLKDIALKIVGGINGN